jgi:transposase
MKTSPHPQWALAHKRKGTELRLISGKYYLYEISSKWSPEKKRPVKITGKLLGRITEAQGFVESDKARLRRQQLQIERVQVKEYGITAAIEALFSDTLSALKQHFPDEWQRLVTLAYGRLVHRSPLKNMAFHYSHSYLSEQYGGVDLSAKSLSYFLRRLGQDRQRIVEFCRSFKISDDCVLFDGTDMFSHSEQMDLPQFSRSKLGTYDQMINLMWIFSAKRQDPLYYRLLPGNIKDVSAFRMSLRESGLKDAIAVMDKGFASKSNIEALENSGLRFIIPLPRNSRLINYRKMQDGEKRLFDGYFKHEGRYIWYYAIALEAKKSITVFLDEELRSREQKDYLDRIDNGVADYSLEAFHEKQYRLGTIAMIENTGKPASDVYATYKIRGDVETMIDALKNIVEADRGYMQNEQALEGWMFINLLALKWYYTILNLLKKHGLNKKYSPSDFLLFLSEIKKVKINNQWYDAEMTRNTREMLESLNILRKNEKG